MLNWSQLDAHHVERAIQALLRELYPDLRSTDGSGGDGGRDAELATSDGRTVFEIKSFTRVASSQRRQIIRSLQRAVESVPDMTRWVLVIPLNQTPRRPGSRSSEEAWFKDTLPAHAPGVELEWRGRDWLDMQIAKHPQFQRYIEGPDAQLLERAKQFGQEQAVLADGSRDLHKRLHGLSDRVDEVSTYWTLDFEHRGDTSTSILRPKHPDAMVMDPITIKPTIDFKTDEPTGAALKAQFERTMAFGGRVSLPPGSVTSLDITASAETMKLLNTSDPVDSAFTFSSARTALKRPVRCTYEVLDEHDQVLTAFPVFLREGTSGAAGVTLYGSDAAGIASFTVNIPMPRDSLPAGQGVVEAPGANLEFDLPESLVGYDIDSLLPLLRARAAVTDGRCVRFSTPSFGRITSGPASGTATDAVIRVLQVVEDLQRLQPDNRGSLSFPDNMTEQDAVDLRSVVRQMDGEAVDHPGGFSLMVKSEGVREFLEAFDSATESGALVRTAELMEIEVGDLRLTYGPACFYAPTPRLTNRSELEETAEDRTSEGVWARFEPRETPFKWLARDVARELLEADEQTMPTGS